MARHSDGFLELRLGNALSDVPIVLKHSACRESWLCDVLQSPRERARGGLEGKQKCAQLLWRCLDHMMVEAGGLSLATVFVAVACSFDVF